MYMHERKPLQMHSRKLNHEWHPTGPASAVPTMQQKDMRIAANEQLRRMEESVHVKNELN